MDWYVSTTIATLLFIPFYVVFPIVVVAGIGATAAIGIWCIGVGLTLFVVGGGFTMNVVALKLTGIILLFAMTVGALANFFAAHAMTAAPLVGIPAGTPAIIISSAPVLAIIVAWILAQYGWHPPVTLSPKHILGIVLVVLSLVVFNYPEKS